MKNLLLGAALGAATISFAPSAVQAQEITICNEITALPATISVPGVYCMKKNLGTGITSGSAVTINANNVTLNMNGYRIGGATAGPTTAAVGIRADGRRNVIIQNGTVRGFKTGIVLIEGGGGTPSSGHIIEDMLIDNVTTSGMNLQGTGLQVRNNSIVNIDSTPPAGGSVGASFQPVQNGSFSVARRDSGSIVSQAGTGSVVQGIASTGISNSIIEGNFLSNFLSPSETYGIITENATNTNIVGNTFESLQGSTFAAGVLTSDSGNDKVVVQNNTVIDVQATNAVGIENLLGTNINCFDNVVVGAATSQTVGCTNESGTLPAAP